jgi:hypothetical protein
MEMAGAAAGTKVLVTVQERTAPPLAVPEQPAENWVV